MSADVPTSSSTPEFFTTEAEFSHASEHFKKQFDDFLKSSDDKGLFCGPTDYIHVTADDACWGGGYRNIQIMFSYLHTVPVFHEHLTKLGVTGIPTIPTIQGLIEKAWAEGFDPESKNAFHGQLVGKKSGIGAVEAWVLFRSLRIPVIIVDVFSPQAAWHFSVNYYRFRHSLPVLSADTAKAVTTTAPHYIDLHEDQFISNIYKLQAPTSYVPPLADPSDPAATDKPSPYLETNVFDLTASASPISPIPPATIEAPDKTTVPFCPPVYTQFVGRSKTLVGVEPLEKGVYNLLFFDPYSPFQADPKEDPVKILNSMRHPPSRIATLTNVFEFVYVSEPRILAESEIEGQKDLESLAASGSPVFQRIF